MRKKENEVQLSSQPKGETITSEKGGKFHPLTGLQSDLLCFENFACGVFLISRYYAFPFIILWTEINNEQHYYSKIL